eukprot:scaffold910_cov396-Prasinococcus_capsulatus_cf.AAC.75
MKLPVEVALPLTQRSIPAHNLRLGQLTEEGNHDDGQDEQSRHGAAHHEGLPVLLRLVQAVMAVHHRSPDKVPTGLVQLQATYPARLIHNLLRGRVGAAPALSTADASALSNG